MARQKRRKRKKPVVFRPIEVSAEPFLNTVLTGVTAAPNDCFPHPSYSGDEKIKIGDGGEAVKITVKAGGKTIKFTIE